MNSPPIPAQPGMMTGHTPVTANLLKSLGYLIIIGCCCVLAVNLLLQGGPRPGAILGVCIGVLILLLVRHSQLKWAAWVLCWGHVVVAITMGLATTGLTSPAWALATIGTMAGGWLLSRQAATILALAGSAGVVGVSLLKPHGFGFSTPPGVTLSSVVVMICIAALIGWATASDFLRRQSQLKASEQRYQALNAELERVVAERTAELRAANEHLQWSEARHRLWADNSADVVWTMSLDGRITYMSPSVLATQGRTPGEAMATPWEEMFTPDSLAVLQRGLAQAQVSVAAGRPVQFHERLEERRKDGTTVWTDVKATSLYDTDGRFIDILGISRDITEQKRIEDELRATRDHLEATINAVPDLLFRVDREGRILDFHTASKGEFHAAPETFLGRTFDAILPEPASRIIKAALEEAAEQGQHRGGTYCLPFPEGISWYELSIAAMSSRVAEFAEFIVVAHDISLRKRQEEQLRISEERHRVIAAITRDVIWTMAPDGRITYVSQAVEQVRGVTAEETMRQPIGEILSPAAQAAILSYLQRVNAAIQAGQRPECYRGEQEYCCKDGKTFWAEVIATPILHEDGSIEEVLGVSRDIDEHKRYERELQLARDAANEANRAKSRFLAHMSHEIRTPMNGVLGLAQILAQGPLTADQRQMVDSILAAGRSLLGIINDILDLSKIEANQLQLDPRPFDLNQTLTHVAEIGGVTARAKGIALRLDVDPAITGGWQGDSLRLEQVLLNLVGNAIKFTNQGEVAIRVRPLDMTTERGRLRFEIQDTGIGMDEATVARLFTPFTQADASITRRFGGTGLGLSISKHLVEMMSGLIGVSSHPGAGSTFWFEWPAERAILPDRVDHRGRKPVCPEPAGEPRLSGLRVLIVDDSAINRMVAERALKLDGAVCTLAQDGEQALRLLREQPEAYDVILMDVQMPVMDGLTATGEIRKHPKLAGLPILALSAGVLEEERESALAAGMNDFINKPLDLQQMREVLAKIRPGG